MKELLGLDEEGAKRPHMLGHFFLAIDIEHFVPLPLFKQIVGSMIGELQGSRKAVGEERIYVAGEKEYEKQQVISEAGIPVNANLKRTLQFMRDALRVEGYDTYF